jgi:uncharacterized protein (TIGR02145 family)
MTGTPWDAMIQSATQKDPAARFSSCEAFLEAINRMGRQKSTGNFSSVSTTLSSILGGLNTVSTILEGLKRPRRKQSNEKAATDSTTIIVDNQTELFGMVKSNEIPSLKIGEQVWMSKNLDVSHFRNGDPIPEARTAKEWTAARKEGKPAWSYYENRRLQDDPIHGQDYGKLYNWYAVNDPRGLAPEGWHVPSDDEWTVLTDTLGGVKAAGNKLKSISGWKYNCNGTNESGFNGLPGGRCIFGRFIHIGVRGVWWSSSPYQYSIDYACSHYLTNGSLESYDNHKGIGCSVRCIQD